MFRVNEKTIYREFTLSIVLPTLNSARTLKECLESIAIQEYAKEKLEFIIIDAGSTDDTLGILEEYRQKLSPAIFKILDNPLRTGEAGKAVGVKAASNEIVCLIDSDNVLPDTDWLHKMVLPFEDSEITGAEPIEYTYRRQDGLINRYGALMGMSDPLCLFLGNYDRYNHITQRWTDIPLEVKDKRQYYKVLLTDKRLPTLGANGFLIRKSALENFSSDYLFDVDIIYDLLKVGKNVYAKVKTGIVHLFAASTTTFIRKQKRRIRDFVYYRKQGLRQHHSRNYSRWGVLKFIVYCLLIFPLIIQALIGFFRKREIAWFFHPLACWITLVVYGWESVRGGVGTDTISREGWRQG